MASAPTQNYSPRNGKSSTFDRSMQSYLKSRMPSSSNVIETEEAKNPKYKYFQKVGMRRPEAVAKNSVALNNDWNNTAFSAIDRDKSFSDLMYSTASMEKPGRLRDYRTMAAFSEVHDVLDEICDETINLDENDQIVTLKLRNTDLEPSEKEELEVEWARFVAYLNLEEHGWRYFRQFLIEGELFFELIVKEGYLNEGVLAVENLPADLIDPVYDNIQNMLIKAFIYKKPIFSTADPQKVERYEFIPFEQNQILYVNSGQYNETKEFVIPFIENARRPLRQLQMVEDAVVIHRMVHAPLRFVFNVDVGRLPVPQAEAYLARLQSQYWSTRTFDIDQADVVKRYSPQSTLDSYWFAKRQGQEATTVQTIGGQPSDGNLDVLDWFIKKLYRSLKTPTSRLNNETTFNDGTEMLREELKFAKMIIRQQQKFASGIKKAYITHLKLRGLYEEYDLTEDNLYVKFNVPTNFYDMRENQKMSLKIQTFNDVSSNDGVSVTWAMKKYLDFKDRDILANRELLRKDKELAWELMQIEQFGPNWQTEVIAHKQEGGPMGGELGGGPPSGGDPFGGGGPSIPEFGGGEVAVDEPEPPPTDDTGSAPASQAGTE